MYHRSCRVVLCLLPLLYAYLFKPARPSSPFSAPQQSRFAAFVHRVRRRGNSLSSQNQRDRTGYAAIDQDEDGSSDGGDRDEQDAPRGLKGWEHALFWLPAFCDICGTTVSRRGFLLWMRDNTVDERRRTMMLIDRAMSSVVLTSS